MQHIKLIFSFVTLIYFTQIKAQEVSSTKSNENSSVIIHKDSRLDLLVNKQATINEVSIREGKRTDKGFRLLIISTNNRDEALIAKAKILSFFPELKAYLWYQSPYFRVKAGNFKDRKDAETYQKRMNIYFPKGVFIMKDIIEAKPGKNNDDN